MKETMPLFTPIKIGNHTAENRIVMNAMECCDADEAGNPTDKSYRRYRQLFEGGAGVVVVEALSVIDESRGRLHQLTALPQNRKELTRFVSEMRKANDKPIMLWQLTHSGELSHPEFSKRVCVKPLPGYEGELLSEEDVEFVLDQFVLAAKMAYDCGADGLYIFNFPCWSKRITARPFHWLEGLNAPDTASRKPLLFSVTYKRNRKEGVDMPPQLPANIEAGDAREFALYLPGAALPAWRCQLLIYSRGDIGLKVNGAPAKENPKLRRAEIFVEHTPQARENYKPMPRPNAADCRLFYADPAALRPGMNRIEVRNAEEQTLTIERIDMGLW